MNFAKFLRKPFTSFVSEITTVNETSNSHAMFKAFYLFLLLNNKTNTFQGKKVFGKLHHVREKPHKNLLTSDGHIKCQITM